MGMVMHFIVGAVVLVAGLLLADPAAACSVPRIRTFHNQTADGQMTVRSGKRCSIVFRSSGPTETHSVVQRPLHGTLQVGSIGRIIYQSRAGYVGADEFTYVRRGRDRYNNPSVRTVHIIVRVRR
jgi:hypothetical protein